MGNAIASFIEGSPSWKYVLQRHFGPTVYRDWFVQLESPPFDKGVLVLSTPSRFVKDWIENHYLDTIKILLRREIEGCVGVQLCEIPQRLKITLDLEKKNQNFFLDKEHNSHRKVSHGNIMACPKGSPLSCGEKILGQRVPHTIFRPKFLTYKSSYKTFPRCSPGQNYTENKPTTSSISGGRKIFFPPHFPPQLSSPKASTESVSMFGQPFDHQFSWNHPLYGQNVLSTHPMESGRSIPTAPLDPRFTFDQFVVGKPNEFAYNAARSVAESEEMSYNPLFLYGPVGHGKTHLMHSIAHTIAERSQGQKKVLYLSAEKFMYYFVRALRFKNIMAFKERFRSVHVLMIDDVQFISGKESTQEEFFHTFNALVDAHRRVIISADKSPSDIEGLPERMKSRLGWGLAVDLHPTNYELRLGILQRKTALQGMEVPMKILEFLAENISSNVRELEGALTRIMAHKNLMGEELSLDLVQSVLKDVLRTPIKGIHMQEVEKRVCDYFQVCPKDLHSPKRSRCVVRPRQIAMFLIKTMTSVSLPAIGRHFGGRDHTTVMHAISTIENLLQKDGNLREDMALLRHALENR